MVNKVAPTELVPTGTRQKIERYFAAGLVKQQAEDAQDPQAFRLSIARRRYREGFTTRESFIAELKALQAPPDQEELEIIAGDLEAAYDYAMDLIAVYREAFRKGNIGIATFAELIAAVVVVPERAETYVARELARLKPEEAPSLGPVVKQYYETDAGKVDVDTIRRQRRKQLIDHNTEVVQLVNLGMSGDQAEAIALNDDVRLAEKGGED